MHAFSVRDDISVCSARSTPSSSWILTGLRRKSSHSSPHFRDDLSEYSNPSNWGERSGPLSLTDHRLAADGLQARRTVGEAILRAQWERHYSDVDLHVESQRKHSLELVPRTEPCCSCRFPRVWSILGRGLESFRWHQPRSATVFTWTDVHSILLLPSEDKGPYLIVITTLRQRDDGSREWLLQAESVRARARWGIEMCFAILHARGIDRLKAHGCCGQGSSPSFSLALFMDMVRVACEVARLQPRASDMARLIEVLDLLVETQCSKGVLPTPVPVAALRRFSDAARHALTDLRYWRQCWEVSHLLRSPEGIDRDLWRTGVLPFLWPLKSLPPEGSSSDCYPINVASRLADAAERCHRTLCS